LTPGFAQDQPGEKHPDGPEAETDIRLGVWTDGRRPKRWVQS